MLLILTSFARSFKEAQAYLIPLMLASLGPGLLGIIPGLKLTGILAVPGGRRSAPRTGRHPPRASGRGLPARGGDRAAPTSGTPWRWAGPSMPCTS